MNKQQLTKLDGEINCQTFQSQMHSSMRVIMSSKAKVYHNSILTGAVTQNGKRMNAPVSISAIVSYID